MVNTMKEPDIQFVRNRDTGERIELIYLDDGYVQFGDTGVVLHYNNFKYLDEHSRYVENETHGKQVTCDDSTTFKTFYNGG